MIGAISLDLDDTLWPIEPIVLRAESALHEWMGRHLPEISERWTIQAMRELRIRIGEQNPHLAHDFTALRKLCLGHAFSEVPQNAEWIKRAFDVFYTARNQVDFYEDSLAALEAMSQRLPLISLTNGNADIHAIGIGDYFKHHICASAAGAAKPDPRIFRFAAQRLGIPHHRIVHIGDDPIMDVVGAKQAGMKAIWLNRRNAAWPLTESFDAEVGSLAEAIPIIESWLATDEKPEPCT